MLETRAAVRRNGETNRTPGCTKNHPVYDVGTESVAILYIYIYAIHSDDSGSAGA